MEARPTTVLLADDHTMFREGLAALLTSYRGLEVVGETTNDQGAVALARQTKPDVVIMQVQMPFEKAKEALDQMHAGGGPYRLSDLKRGPVLLCSDLLPSLFIIHHKAGRNVIVTVRRALRVSSSVP